MKRMLAALALVLAFGAVVAALAGEEAAGFALLFAVLAFLGATVIAALLIAVVAAARALLGHRPVRPPDGVIAAALAVGALVVFPVYTNFYESAESAAYGGGVGYCGGSLPLAQVAYNRITDETVGRVYYSASCDD